MTNPRLKSSDLKSEIHAAIITIRPDEYNAMEARLGTVRSVVGNNTYKYAQILTESGHPISVVLTRVVGQGNSKAQAVASNIIQELDPAWLILVGIAGGVPDNEFSLGDVILATYLSDFSFGAANKGAATYHSQGGNMHRDVERFLATAAVGADGEMLRQLAGFDTDSRLVGHPVVYTPEIAEADRYYGSEVHQKKVKDTIERRFPGGTRAGGPTVWQGACANGNVLVKDADLLTKWQQSARQLVHVETELGGVYEAARTAGREDYPVLAIRGLSDIVGFARDANWTEYACQTAAAYASAVLRSGLIEFESNLPTGRQVQTLTTGCSMPASGPNSAPQPRKVNVNQRTEILALFAKLKTHQFGKLFFRLGVPPKEHPAKSLNHEERQNELLTWADEEKKVDDLLIVLRELVEVDENPK